MRKYMKGPERFWAYVERGEEDRCWLWKGPVNNGRYGVFTINKNGRRTSRTAHRHAWELTHRQEAPASMVVMHSCDTPLCCNPNHLKVGSQKENYDDMVAKSRADRQRGHKRRFAPRHKAVDYFDVQAMFEWKAMGLKNWEIAPKFGISEGYASSILTGKRKAEPIMDFQNVPNMSYI